MLRNKEQLHSKWFAIKEFGRPHLKNPFPDVFCERKVLNKSLANICC